LQLHVEQVSDFDQSLGSSPPLATLGRRDGVFEAPEGSLVDPGFLALVGQHQPAYLFRVTLGREPEDVRVLLGRDGFLDIGLIPQAWNGGVQARHQRSPSIVPLVTRTSPEPRRRKPLFDVPD
jgi:hypothetical protein